MTHGFGRWQSACTSACDQGRKQCPTPIACRLLSDDQDEIDGIQRGCFVVPIVSVLVIAIIVIGALLW